MNSKNWFNEVPFSITVCDINGVILEMNEKSGKTFEKDGGKELIGKTLMNCHSPRDQRKITEMIASQATNVYTIENEGTKKMIFQCPWYENGVLGGLVEISLPLPAEIPHFIRGSKIIYHITDPAQWQKAQQIGQYLPANYEKDGFIHCSKKEQVCGVGERYYVGQKGLLILSINIEKLTSKLVYENGTGGEGEKFPHLYGPLNLTAVEFLADFGENESGTFEFPKEWVPAREK